MLLSIIIIGILAWTINKGYRRGLVAEIIYTIGNIVVFLFAKNYNRQLSNILNQHLGHLLNIPTNSLTIFNSISFMILMSLGWSVIHLIARFARSITWLPIIHQVNQLGGAIVSGIITLILTYICLSISQYLPIDSYQTQLSNSTVAQFILNKTPSMSSQLNNFILNTPETKRAMNFVTNQNNKSAEVNN